MDFINKILCGDSLELLKQFPENYFDSCVADPPYAIGFMNMHWDYTIPSIDHWKEVYRVMKPGAHALVACGTRTQHRMVCNIEDGGFEIRDVICWHYGQGFPKSLDISKTIDRNEAEKWSGWGTGLKPATEFWTLCRKPISERTISENVIKWGTGAININDCRVDFVSDEDKQSAVWGRGTDIMGGNYVGATHGNGKENIAPNDNGRWPANLILDQFMGEELNRQAPNAGAFAPVKSGMPGESKGIYGDYAQKGDDGKTFYSDSGGAARFFYCPKPDTAEREKGLRNFDLKEAGIKNEAGRGFSENDPYKKIMRRNNHPTVKPIELMQYLVKLITQKKGIVLDPFCGSGPTCIGAKLELMNYIGIDKEENYCRIAEARLAAWNPDQYVAQKLF